ncbi:hypothetical protein M2340_000778 [Sphingobium sp. B2D3D]|nr:hypothetical protein [Sphingobium sp. B2D3D]
MEINEFARHMDGDELPQAFAIIDIARHDPFDQEAADIHNLTRVDNRRAGLKGANLENRVFERGSFFRRQGHAAAVCKEAIHQHRVANG